MSDLAAILKANPGLLAMLLLLIGAAFVLALVGLFMVRAGVSLRPILWFAVFFGLVVLPQAVGHLLMARRPVPAAPAAAAAQPTGADAVPPLPLDGGRFANPQALYGTDVDPQLIQDARPVFREFLEGASHAELAIFPTGSTVVVAAFATAEEARTAAAGYVRYFGIPVTEVEPGREWHGPRPAVNDRAALRVSGPVFIVWTAADTAQLSARQRATTAVLPAGEAGPLAGASTQAPAAGASSYYFDQDGVLLRLFRPMAVKLAGILLLLAVVVLWFFKGATWASSTPPVAGIAPVSAATLRARLLAAPAAGAPFEVSEQSDGQIEVVWRYADARWADHARVHQVRRVQRLLLSLDDGASVVRVRESWAAIEGAAGLDGARLEWKTGMGITFFEARTERVFGLVFSADGKPSLQPSYTWSFSTEEMKGPFRAAVTGAGWSWRPVMLAAPPALSWLTE